MRKITLLFGCFIGLCGAVMAQDLQQSSEIDGLLNRLSQIGNNMGNVSDYFTLEEQATLRTHFAHNRTANSYNGVLLENAAPHSFVSGNAPGVRVANGPAGTATEVLLGQRAPVTITQNNSQTIVDGLGLTCQSGGITTDNQLAGVFNLSADFGINVDWEIQSVEFGVDEVLFAPGDAYPVTVNAYTTTSDPNGTLTLLGSTIATIGSADDLSVVAVAMPAGVVVPAGGVLVIELQVFNDGITGFRLGATDVASNDDSWILAADCGLTTYGTYASLGFNDRWHVMNVVGEDVSVGGPAVVFGINNSTTTLVSFDPADPTVLNNLGISPAAGFENAGAIDPNDQNTAYVLDNGGAFYSVDLTTGVYTSLGNITAPNGESWSGAEFDAASGTMYAMSTNITTSTLSTIDTGAATATTVGMTGMAGAISLMIDGAGQGYSHDIVDDTFYAVDLTTGTATPIGSLGFDANFGQGGTYNPGDGFVYLSAYDNGSAQSQWRQVDVTNGSSTVIGLFNGGADQVSWSSVQGGTAGVSENALEGFAYYPNPTSDVLSLKSVNSIDSVSIYNLLGQRVIDTKIGATTSDINLSGLTAGTYIMKVTVAGQIGTYKVLKN